MKLGMVGLPNTGKSTLFNALTNAGAASSNYPFSTIESNLGRVSVPDPRLERLAELYKPDKFTPASLEFVDIAGLVKGSWKGEGLGNKFLASIREVDAIIHVVRCFEDELVVHPDGSINAKRDIETINLELVFADLEILERKFERTKKMLKGGREFQKEADFLEALITYMSEGKTARSYDFDDYGSGIIRDVPLLSAKPVIYAANMHESDFPDKFETNPNYISVKESAESENCAVLPVCAKTEADIAQMDEEDRALFLEELGMSESGLSRIIKQSYALLGLISFLTAGPQEVRAWTIKQGTTARRAAGKIHTDMEKGFIKAEVASFSDVDTYGSTGAAKEKGLMRLEGRDYIIKDGDVVLFRFNR
ncbi:MAG: redox-regulated ATPase YchF [Oscillospiraceae bacterium]|jgi:GTP-binding protein YchF|nr:redox-regulated ATPase YchF [Oscillospiraceae bacterium]